MGRRSVFSSVSHLTCDGSCAELDDIEKEVAPLAQDLPIEIEDEIIPPRNLLGR